MTKTIALILALCGAAQAMEISLEENRGQRGSIGYVDLQAVFRRFPEVGRAKQSYAEIVRQAEEQVNLKKAELIRLRADISTLKAERDAASRAPLYVPPPAPAPAPVAPLPEPTALPEAAPEPAATPAPVEAAAPAEPASPLTGLPGMSSNEPLRIAIPGMPEETLSAAAPTATPPAAAAPAAAPVVAAPAPVPSAAEAQAQAQAEEQLRRRDAKVKEFDASIAAKEAELASKQGALGGYQAQVEKDLVNIESKRSELLLGRIYAAVKDTAVENGVSVVIDKTAILFGQGSVDLTDKVLKKLEGALP